MSGRAAPSRCGREGPWQDHACRGILRRRRIWATSPQASCGECGIGTKGRQRLGRGETASGPGNDLVPHATATEPLEPTAKSPLTAVDPRDCGRRRQRGAPEGLYPASPGRGAATTATTETNTASSADLNDQRRALHAYLSDDAHDTWHEVAADLGCSVSAMLEAMAADFDRPGDERTIEDRIGPIVKKARRIDAE